MKKTVLAMLVLAVFMLTGCSLTDAVKGASGGAMTGVDTLKLTKGGVELDEYSKEAGASAEEIETFVKNEIGSVPGVKLEKCAEKDGKICVKTSYDNMITYSEFTGYGLGYGTVLDGRLSGLSFGEMMYSVEDSVVTSNNYSINDTDKYAAVYQTITVLVPGEITAISDTAAVCGKSTAYVHANEDGSPVIIIYK